MTTGNAAPGSAIILGDVTLQPVTTHPQLHSVTGPVTAPLQKTQSLQFFAAIRDGKVERVREFMSNQQQSRGFNPHAVIVWRTPMPRAVVVSALELAVLTLNLEIVVLLVIEGKVRPDNVFDGRVRVPNGRAQVVQGFESVHRGGHISGFRGLRILLGAWRDGQDRTVASLSPKSRKNFMLALLVELEQLIEGAWPPLPRFWVGISPEWRRHLLDVLATVVLCTRSTLRDHAVVSMSEHIVNTIALAVLDQSIRCHTFDSHLRSTYSRASETQPTPSASLDFD